MMRWWAKLICTAALGCGFSCFDVGWAEESPRSDSLPTETSCRSVESDVERLKCYDAAPQQGNPKEDSIPSSPPAKALWGKLDRL